MGIVNTLKNAWGATKIFVIKNAPTILTVSGTVATVAGTFFAAKGSLKLHEVMEERNREKDMIEQAHEQGLEGYSEEDYKKDLLKCKTTTAKELVKLYWPAAACTVVGVTGILSGHGMMRSRNAALGAAVIAGERAFDAYRNRVKDAIGEEAENKLSFPVKEWIEKHDIVNPETGEVQEVEEKRREIVDPVNIYSMWWDERSYCCKNDPFENMRFLRETQCNWNDILNRRGKYGVVFLNEVIKDLDLDLIQVGQLAGWKYGDVIDFGINKPVNQDFIDGVQEECFLNFNCRGNVLKCLPRHIDGGKPCEISEGDGSEE